eukprot:TRINITY_DN2272_c0_g3_i3.p1 TRINITY_DN2272_c0_g3~~TRINITY_DN2272_c0_g3_i3.p1  ORF type:complete len:494 (-),score=110.56 TRINITY_DN2272_c0_g3_i3:812-2293(-)
MQHSAESEEAVKRVSSENGESSSQLTKKSRRVSYPTPEGWTPSSWRTKTAKQLPHYEDQAAVTKATDTLSALPPLVHAGEVDALKQALREAGRGKRFLLQGGDCAEAFKDCNELTIENKVKIILQMSLILTWGARIPLVRVARIAGQFAKPRSKPTEIVDGQEIPAYRGDNVNGMGVHERKPDPNRMVQSYFYSSCTLNYIRASIGGGVADIRNPQFWELDFFRCENRRVEYEETVQRMLDSLDFLKTIDSNPSDSSLRSVDIYTSHEGLLLPYEEALTRQVGEQYYNLSGHFLWIGDRTRDLDGAHVEYFRGIANPIGIKVGPTTNSAELVQLLKTINPNNEEGRVTLISRMGASKVMQHLPSIISAVRQEKLNVVWSCDPMHGNTTVTESGFKTRHFDDIVTEIHLTFDAHESVGSSLNGVHLELTGDHVTECVGGPQELNESHLSENYTTHCDPRLNYAQSLEVAFLLAKHLAKDRLRRHGSHHNLRNLA